MCMVHESGPASTPCSEVLTGILQAGSYFVVKTGIKGFLPSFKAYRGYERRVKLWQFRS